MGFCCIPGGIGKLGTLDLTLHGRLFDGVEIAVGFQSDVLTQLNENLLVFHLWVGYLLNTSDEKS